MNATQQAVYDDTVVRQFSIMTVVWGVVGMLVGVIVASQLAWPELNFGIPFLSYGRLRPLHTNAVIFAFGGCALFATSYYVVQRTCHTALFAPALAKFTFWGWQLIIVLAAVTLPLGYTSGKEYAELEWPIDILIAVVWVAYAIVVFFQLLTNGVLTRLQVFRYSDSMIVGSQPDTGTPPFIGSGRIAYQPFEDLLMGFSLCLLACALWIYWGRRGVQREPMSGPPIWRTWAARKSGSTSTTSPAGADPGGAGHGKPSA